MSVFNFTDYRDFLQNHRRQLPRKGWGFVSQLAAHLGVSQVHVSQVLSGTTDFSMEQALLVAEYLNLGDAEKEFFIWLIIQAKSGSEKLNRFSGAKLRSLRNQAKQLKGTLNADKILSEEQQNIFYSNYMYSAIRLFASTGRGKSLEEISLHFQISPASATRFLDFLVSAELLQKHRDGRFAEGSRRTFLPRESPNYLRNLINWRLRSLQSASSLSESEIMFTSPVSLSKQDFEKIQIRLLDLIKEVSGVVRDSPSEIVACWNLDWFELKP